MTRGLVIMGTATPKSHGTAQGEKSDRGAGGGGEGGEDGDKQRGCEDCLTISHGRSFNSLPPLKHLLLPLAFNNQGCLR